MFKNVKLPITAGDKSICLYGVGIFIELARRLTECPCICNNSMLVTLLDSLGLLDAKGIHKDINMQPIIPKKLKIQNCKVIKITIQSE